MIKKIEPKGFLKGFLKTQMKGLTGHIEEAGFPFDKIKWGEADVLTNNENPGWWVYEQTAYHLDGFTRAAILLRDREKISQAKETIYKVLNAPDFDGYLGPRFLKETTGWNRWPHVVFFRACMALYEYNNDETILLRLTDHYLKGNTDFSLFRDVLNVEIMLWLYGKTSNKKLLKLAEKTYSDYQEKCADDNCDKVALSNKKPYAHGVTYNEYSKLGAILYNYTNEKKYLDASIAAFKKAEKLFMLPGGCICSNEFMINKKYMQSYETCDITDYTYSLSYMFKATKDPHYGDNIEKCVFNAGLGSVTEDFKALQYFSCANQFISDDFSNHNSFFKGSKWMRYAPNPGTECCAGNVNRFMPNYVLNMWYNEDDKIYSLLFGASKAEFELNGKRVVITQKEDYPFNEKLRYEIKTKTPFEFYIRIPKWAKNYSLSGAKYSIKKGFAVIKVKADCIISVDYSSDIETKKAGNGYYFTKGVFTYSYPIQTKTEKVYSEDKSKAFPALRMYPAGEWRYCLLNENPVFKNSERDFGKDFLPKLTLKAKVISNYQLKRRKSVNRCTNLYVGRYKKIEGDFTFTPPLMKDKDMITSEDIKDIELIPYGFTKLRVTVFNKEQK